MIHSSSSRRRRPLEAYVCLIYPTINISGALTSSVPSQANETRECREPSCRRSRVAVNIINVHVFGQDEIGGGCGGPRSAHHDGNKCLERRTITDVQIGVCMFATSGMIN